MDDAVWTVAELFWVALVVAFSCLLVYDIVRHTTRWGQYRMGQKEYEREAAAVGVAA